MSLTGTWQLSIATIMGEQKAELELVQHGPDKISGLTRTDQDGEREITDPQFKDNKLTWKATYTRPIKVTATMELTFDGDTCTGTAKAGMLIPASKITGRRVQ
jgi:hypothetical protein